MLNVIMDTLLISILVFENGCLPILLCTMLDLKENYFSFTLTLGCMGVVPFLYTVLKLIKSISRSIYWHYWLDVINVAIHLFSISLGDFLQAAQSL